MYILKFYYICNNIMDYNTLTDEELEETFEDYMAEYFIDLAKSEG